MKLLIISIFTLTALALAESWLFPEPPLEFDIDTTYIPEDCTVLRETTSGCMLWAKCSKRE
jgi:hypothetical protein